MIEAKIICSHPCDIPDLNIFGLKRGEERWVSAAAAQASQDLAKEQGKGHVRVYRKVRRKEAAPRRPAPPFVAASRPAVPERADPEVVEKHIERVVEVESSVDVDELARKMKAELIGDLIPDLKDAIAQEVGRALAEHPQQKPEPAPAPASSMDAAQLENVLEGVLRRVGVSGGGGGAREGSRAEGPEDPLFIPTAIVDKDAKGKISVKSKKSEGTDDLDDAQAALREMKRARRGRKKGNEEK